MQYTNVAKPGLDQFAIEATISMAFGLVQLVTSPQFLLPVSLQIVKPVLLIAGLLVFQNGTFCESTKY